jgi:uncharacterized RDD family membrane protein YckC
MKTVTTWRKVVAFLIDFLGAFFIFGFAIGALTGSLTDGGFQLEGIPALILFIVIIAYFVVMNKYLGGTIGKRILGIAGKG